MLTSKLACMYHQFRLSFLNGVLRAIVHLKRHLEFSIAPRGHLSCAIYSGACKTKHISKRHPKRMTPSRARRNARPLQDFLERKKYQNEQQACTQAIVSTVDVDLK